MNPSPSPAKETSTDDSEHEDSEPTPTEAPPRPGALDLTPCARPHLVRSPPGRLSEIEQDAHDDSLGDSTDGASSNDDAAKTRPKGTRAESGGSNSTPLRKAVVQIPTPEKLGELQAAIDNTMRSKMRPRRSYGPSGSKNEKGRVSPIKEEGSSSGTPTSSINAVLNSTEEPLRTTSTESTESSKTIRGSVPPTPSGNPPLRTPSYPFPYVPGTPRSWSQNFHQPFTSLSPTVTNSHEEHGKTPGTRSFSLASGGSTPAANTAFIPSGQGFEGAEDPRYPTPSLYDLVLQLNTEPGMEQWWANVTNILHDNFLAERATLVQPVDPTDIENVPWGQKATFSMNGREEFVPQGNVFEQMHNMKTPPGMQRPEFVLREPSTDMSEDMKPQKLHPERLRPRLEARHSYAGHGREVKDVLATLNDPPMRRPQGPQRTATHAAGMTPTAGPDRIPPKRFPSVQSIRHGSLSDPDFSSVGGKRDSGPYAEVFSTLHTLDHEARPLIESGGVNRVLDRGRLVLVTRDYGNELNRPFTTQSAPASSPFAPTSAASFGNYRAAFASDNTPEPYRDYHEYEQHPPSPWAQSPAPSPAIQADEEINPFFASEEQLLEETFNPAVSPKDYSQYDQVEAIGVDYASTVIHIPLIHPTLSQPMQSFQINAQGEASGLRRSNTLDRERKAPIAILSILTSTVPYPSNLAHTLKLLGPHLATSYSIAQQFSDTHARAVKIRHRRTASGHQAKTAPMTIEPASLEDIVHADLEDVPGSMSGSVTSPSDYSGRSRISPSGSIVGTPGWDPSAHGWTQSRSVAGTPAVSGTEMVDNYFETKKRSGQRSASNASNTTAPKSAKKPSISEGRSVQEETTPSDRKARQQDSSKQSKSPVLPASKERSPSRTTNASSSRKKDRPTLSELPVFDQNKRHSLLHSYGADFEHSFPIVPSPVETKTPGTGAHMRKGSYPEDMPPPSERLLRTIIDSVPVQIFTAQPETGVLTWVNSKFLIYRGQEPRQVLSDPWHAIHPEDRHEFLPAWQRSLRSNQQLQQKVRLQRFDNNYRWFYVRAAPLKDKNQKTVHWIGTMMDFHDQQIAEINSARQQETAASEAKYRALANSSPQIVFAVTKSRGVTFCNTQWLQFSGQTEAQALGTGFMQHVHPEDLAKCRLPSFEDDTGMPTNVPTSLPSEPRRTLSTSVSSSSGSSETEKPQSSSETTSPMQPMPQRKLSLLAATGILKVTMDADGRPSYSTEVRLKSKDGHFRWHLVRVLLAEPLIHHENEEETWYGTCTDISDHKALEKDLKDTMDAKSRFLSNMSHEIRTPLNGITGMVNFLIDSSLTAEQMEHVNIIRASTEGLRGLINDILDLSKAEAGMIQLNVEWVYVRALIEEVNDLTSAMAIDKGLELNYLVDENVPAQIKGDRFRIRQILLNIVGNAIKFTQRGEVFVRCSVKTDGPRLDKSEMFIKFEIIDTGRGFTDEEAEFLFKRFSQIDGSSTRQHGGTGLGLVISKQLAQLHGGDMSAHGVPNEGSTFMFYIKTNLPTEDDRPPEPLPTPGVAGLQTVPASPGPAPISMTSMSKASALPLDPQIRLSPKFAPELTQTPPSHPSPDTGKESPSTSASSDPSLRSAVRTDSLRSERSSASSIVPDAVAPSPPLKLNMPSELHPTRSDSESSRSIDAVASSNTGAMLKPPGGLSPPPMFSILVVAPLKYSREATVQHIDKTLPRNIPHQITSRPSYSASQDLLAGDEKVIFTHVVVVLQEVDEIVALMDQILWSTHSTTAIVLITDLAQRRKITEQAPNFDYDQLVADRRLRFVFKPLKPSRFGLIFDPQKEREMSLDRNQDSAQQLAVNQKQVFEELARKLGNKDKRVLLVEDNRVNQMVILKFLAKVSIKVDTVLDGVQCTDKVFAKPPGYYSIILCDLHMPNKDGYQTCKEIRSWETKNQYAHLPIIALSANVLGDVYQKCVEAGFNSYMTKPVDFKELSQLLMAFMDPSDPSKPHEFMRLKHTHGHRSSKKASAA